MNLIFCFIVHTAKNLENTLGGEWVAGVERELAKGVGGGIGPKVYF